MIREKLMPYRPRNEEALRLQEQVSWILQQHIDTNHFYDEYLPYEFHLRMAFQAYKDWKHLIPSEAQPICYLAAWGHDLIEDTRTTYNDVKKVLGKEAAEIIRAVTNYGRGRDRDERMPDFCYEDICNTPGGTFTKLCDRIANVQYSKMTKSSMFKKYKEENDHFFKMLKYSEFHELKPMFDYIIDLFETA
jgi:(p)ppGpp synthase/HD superfamily hydrolase